MCVSKIIVKTIWSQKQNKRKKLHKLKEWWSFPLYVWPIEVYTDFFHLIFFYFKSLIFLGGNNPFHSWMWKMWVSAQSSISRQSVGFLVLELSKCYIPNLLLSVFFTIFHHFTTMICIAWILFNNDKFYFTIILNCPSCSLIPDVALVAILLLNKIFN